MRIRFTLFLLFCGMLAGAQTFRTGTYYGRDGEAVQYDFRDDGTFARTQFFGHGAEPLVAEGRYAVTATTTADSIQAADSLKLDFAGCTNCHPGRDLYFLNGKSDTLAVIRLTKDTLNGSGWQRRIQVICRRGTSFKPQVDAAGQQLSFYTDAVAVNDVIDLVIPGAEQIEIPIRHSKNDTYTVHRSYTIKMDEAVGPVSYKLDWVTDGSFTIKKPDATGSAAIRYTRMADSRGVPIEDALPPKRERKQRGNGDGQGFLILLDVVTTILFNIAW